MLFITIPSLLENKKKPINILQWHYSHLYHIISPLLHPWDCFSEIEKNTRVCIALYYIKIITKEDYINVRYITDYYLDIILRDIESVKVQLTHILVSLGKPALELSVVSATSKSEIWFGQVIQSKEG